jgi:anti-sigma B factor antagonist
VVAVVGSEEDPLLGSGLDSSTSDADQLGHVSVVRLPDATVIRLSGEIDLALDEDLNVAARAAVDADRPVQLDLREVTFMDSTGLRLIGRLIGPGLRPQVLGPNDYIVDLLTSTGLASLIKRDFDATDVRRSPSDEP